jgi:putative acetyltransferase
MPGFHVSQVLQPTPDLIDLIDRHFAAMKSQTPEESCHVMGAEDLFASGAHVFALQDDQGTVGMGAIKPLDPQHGELKSMHTKAEARGRGIGTALLAHLLDQARALGLRRVSLETGSEDHFAPARRLYERHGFTYCPPFADYVEDPLSVFMTRSL